MKKSELVDKNCKSCDTVFSLVPWLAKVSNFCSKSCRYDFISTKKERETDCQTCHLSFVASSSSTGKFCSIECYWNSKTRRDSHKCMNCEIKISPVKSVMRCRDCASKLQTGEKHWNWQGGLSGNRDIHSLNNKEYKNWRTAVFKRDEWTCSIADKMCEGTLEAHHILRWSEFPELRYKVNNGIALCHAHHPRMKAEEKRLIPTFVELVSVSNRSLFL